MVLLPWQWLAKPPLHWSGAAPPWRPQWLGESVGLIDSNELKTLHPNSEAKTFW